jgi:hypothetical protein
MRKIILPLAISIFIIFLIGLLFSKKEATLKIVKENQEQKQKETPTSSLPASNKKTESLFILDLERKINEDVSKLTENIKPDEKKNINDYRKEVAEIQQRFSKTKNVEPDVFIKIAQDLSKINPPPLIYPLHLELIKVYYKLGLALDEFEKTNDPTQKILLYNLIKSTLEQIKF